MGAEYLMKGEGEGKGERRGGQGRKIERFLIKLARWNFASSFNSFPYSFLPWNEPFFFKVIVIYVFLRPV